MSDDPNKECLFISSSSSSSIVQGGLTRVLQNKERAMKDLELGMITELGYVDEVLRKLFDDVDELKIQIERIADKLCEVVSSNEAIVAEMASNEAIVAEMGSVVVSGILTAEFVETRLGMFSKEGVSAKFLKTTTLGTPSQRNLQGIIILNSALSGLIEGFESLNIVLEHRKGYYDLEPENNLDNKEDRDAIKEIQSRLGKLHNVFLDIRLLVDDYSRALGSNFNDSGSEDGNTDSSSLALIQHEYNSSSSEEENPYRRSYSDFVIKDVDRFALDIVEEDLVSFLEVLGEERNIALLELPVDLFMDIFSRLSIKSLAVCRCVCKTWLRIIHDWHFVKLHTAKLIQQPPHLQSNSFLIHVSASLLYDLTEIKQRALNLLFSEIYVLETTAVETLEDSMVVNPQLMPDKLDLLLSDLRFEVVGSCNGLVLLADSHHYNPLCVCNPVIGEYITLPSTDESLRCYDIMSGLVFDHVNNCYKVIKMKFAFEERHGYKSRSRMTAELYTVGFGDWRKVGDFTYPHFRRSTQVLVGGVLHWMSDENHFDEFIISFDVVKEQFNIIPPPIDFTESTVDCEMHLGELGGYLCLCCYSSDNFCEVWVMKTHGIRDSWTKNYVISRKVAGFSDVRFDFLKLMENGDVIIVFNHEFLVRYDPKSNSCQKLTIQLPPNFQATNYVGSFISLRDMFMPSNSPQCFNIGTWYGTMKSITSHIPDFDIHGWKLNEEKRLLWES